MAIITISRGAFSGAKELAECVAKKLAYHCVSRKVLVEAASQYGAPLDKLLAALTDRPGILEGMTLERAHYLAYIRAALSKYAKLENLVYHGHAGHLLLKGVPHVLRVKVAASMSDRIGVAMESRNLTYKQATDFIHKIDSDREKWMKFLYHVEWNDVSLYDLVINLERMTVSNACDIICLTAGRQEFQPTAQSQRVIDNFILATDVRAKIASDAGVVDDRIEVEAHDGTVIISGSVRTTSDADSIREVVRRLPHVERFETRIGARW